MSRRGTQTYASTVVLLLQLLLVTAATAQYSRGAERASDLQASTALPPGLEQVGFDQRIGAKLPLTAAFVDEAGKDIVLGDVFGQRPVLLALVYYECPMLCNLVLNGVVSTLKGMNLEPGRDFDVVAVSFDPGEGPTIAAAKKATYLQSYGRPETAPGWHFLTGHDAAIRELTAAVGFRYRYLPKDDQFAHASGIIIVTPDGLAARYFYGIQYAPRDVRLGLVEAANGKLGNVVDQMLLFCFHYDPASGTYGAATLNLIRLGGIITVLVLAVFIIVSLTRERARRGVTSHA